VIDICVENTPRAHISLRRESTSASTMCDAPPRTAAMINEGSNMKAAKISGAEFNALSEGSSNLRAARILADGGDRTGAMAVLRKIVDSLPSPSVEPTQRLRMSAELFLAQLSIHTSDAASARDHLAKYRAMAAEWFPTDESCQRQVSAVLDELDKVDPAD
jgi:hypothetical protein